ncbi:MAG: carbamoyl-phosphate synthase large subunit [Aquificaceae bacterium]|nr:carbamoyl-phosphate synthase large subunit [Aquificaceae bacterium]MDW8237326.1 carbamoyl-phosphate synthase large subunit [Aquificaceae bacterium]
MKKVLIIGSGPNRIGQGIEFDYACVHASLALKEIGIKTIMLNCNPETVSTDFDISDRLYFEPITIERVLDIIRRESPDGVFIQFGGQTPLKLALELERNGVNILGTKPSSIDLAEDRALFKNLIESLGFRQPRSKTAKNLDEAIRCANEVGFPILVRPSYVLGGRAMRIIHDSEELSHYLKEAVEVSEQRPILIDEFLSNSVELDVDAISDGEDCLIGGVMEHIEEAGIHSGDSAASIPPYTIQEELINQIKTQTKALAKALDVVGLLNVQFALKDGEIYILEANPRSSRTIPFVSKAIGYPLAKISALVGVGMSLKSQLPEVFKNLSNAHIGSDFLPKEHDLFAVKEVVFPWERFPEEDPLLGPEMRSTGEVMAFGKTFGIAYYKAQLAAGNKLPLKGKVFVSLSDDDKPKAIELCLGLISLGFEIYATEGTHEFLKRHSILSKPVSKLSEGNPNALDLIKNQELNLIINTPSGKRERSDAKRIRQLAIFYRIPYTTTLRGAYAMLEAIRDYSKLSEIPIFALQDIIKNAPSAQTPP